MTAPPPPRAVMFDLDGTLILSDRQLGGYRVLPGAPELLAELGAAGIPYIALTNGSAFPSHVQGPKLRAVGLPIPDERLFTPNSVAIRLFAERSHTRVMVIGTEGVHQALAEGGIATCRPGDPGADAVYVGWAPECTMADIHAACEAVLDGAAFYTASDVPFFATQGGRSFGYSSAIVGGIARVTGREPEVTGKPSPHAMRIVAEALGVPAAEVAVVGDDPRVEIEMAVAAGATGIGVTTGTASADDWAAQPPHRSPTHVIDHLAELRPLLLGSTVR